MKKTLVTMSCLGLLALSVVSGFSQIPIQEGAQKRLFFLGNSLVGNKLDGIGAYVQAACKASSPAIDFEQDHYIEGGKNLAYFWQYEHIKEKIRNGNYDIVVLQDYYDDQDDPETFWAAADSFNTFIRSLGALPVFYMRWPNGPHWRGMETFDSNVKLLQESYDAIAKKLNIPVAPANLVWQQLTHTPYGNYPNTWLYSTESDGSIDVIHPSEIGKYATALSFYCILTQQSPIGVYFNFGFEPLPSREVQAHIQKAVWDVISSREPWAVTSNYLRVDPLSLSFASAAESKSISVSTDQPGLSAQPSASWITPTLNSGSVKVSVSENTTGTERSGTVTISAGSLSKTVLINQQRQRLCNFSLSKNALSLDWRDTTTTVTVSTDQPWQATKSSDWVSLSQSGNTLTITLAQNSVRSFRYDSVVVQGCEREVISIAQNFPNSADEEWDSLVIQAEDFSAASGYEATDWPKGFSGTSPKGAIKAETTLSTISWTVPITQSGPYSLAFTYDNGNPTPRSANLLVNSTQTEALSFAPTGGWGASFWRSLQTAAPITLNAGANTIQLSFTAKGPVFDKLTIKYAASTPVHTPHAATSASVPFSLTISGSAAAQITYTLPQSGAVTIRLYSLQGKIIEELFAGHQNQGSHHCNLDNGALRPGLYLVELSSGAQRVSRQFSIIR
jgi:hypothetical protein